MRGWSKAELVWLVVTQSTDLWPTQGFNSSVWPTCHSSELEQTCGAKQSRWLNLYLISWQLVFELLHLGLCVVHDALSCVHGLHTFLQQTMSPWSDVGRKPWIWRPLTLFLTFLLRSSSAYFSAFFTMFSMSSLLRPPEDWITTAQKQEIHHQKVGQNRHTTRQSKLSSHGSVIFALAWGCGRSQPKKQDNTTTNRILFLATPVCCVASAVNVCWRTYVANCYSRRCGSRWARTIKDVWPRQQYSCLLCKPGNVAVGGFGENQPDIWQETCEPMQALPDATLKPTDFSSRTPSEVQAKLVMLV